MSEFTFTAENETKAQAHIAKYPEGRQASAVLPLLDIAQRQNGGHLTDEIIEYIARYLGMANIRVREVATFYTMFHLNPVGRFHLQVCGTTPCWLRGSDELFEAIREECGIGRNEVSADGMFSCAEVECLGACVNAPMIQINDDYYEDLDKERTKALLRALRDGKEAKTGSQIGRRSSEPEGGPTVLREVK